MYFPPSRIYAVEVGSIGVVGHAGWGVSTPQNAVVNQWDPLARPPRLFVTAADNCNTGSELAVERANSRSGFVLGRSNIWPTRGTLPNRILCPAPSDEPRIPQTHKSIFASTVSTCVALRSIASSKPPTTGLHSSRGMEKLWRTNDHNRYLPAEKSAKSLPNALGPRTEELKASQLDAHLISDQELPEISDVEFIASYNLVQGLERTILVPGRPALWTPFSTVTKLTPDSGAYYRDENSARFPEYPFEPAVRSILSMNQSFESNSVDIVACGSTLGNLLRFVLGQAEPFTLIAHAVGTTVFLVRREHDSQELIQGIHGFGHSFVEANTTWEGDMISSSSHQRLISYFLGPHRVILRFEVDSYTIDQSDEVDNDEDVGGVTIGSSTLEDDMAALWGAKMSPTGTAALEIVQRGTPAPLTAAIDIKTRSSRKIKETVVAEQLPRLWIRQIEQLVLAFHDKGIFQPARIEDVSGALANWEQQNKDSIARLINLISLIRTKADEAKSAKLELRCDGRSLAFHRLSAKHTRKWSGIPEDLSQRWASGPRDVRI
ncbi:hypothetical protein BST61_g11454 [Cercospora zeina]